MLLLTATAAAASRGDTVVRVLGPGGRGLPKVPLKLVTACCERVRALATDYAGKATLEDVPWDGSLRVQTYRLGRGGLDKSIELRWRRPWAPVTGPEVELFAKAGLPVSLAPVDAASGERVRGATWRSEFAILLEELETVAEEGPHTLFARPGESGSLILHVRESPEGYVAWDRFFEDIHVSRFASSAVVRYPLRREAAVFVHARGAGPLAYGFRTALRVKNSQVGERDAEGRVRLRGVPFHPGVPLEVMVTPEIPEGWNEGSVVTDPGRELFRREVGGTPYAFLAIPGGVVVEGLLPEQPEEELSLEARLPGRGAEPPAWPVYAVGGSGIGRRGGGPAPPRPFPTGAGDTATVRVLRRNGEPAPGAKVSIRHGAPRVLHQYLRADARGVARFEGVQGGWADFRIIEPGMVRTSSGRVALDREVTLREGEGGTIAVRVVDAKGRGLPFAKLRVETTSSEHVRGPVHSWIDEEKGIQRVDPFTDERGCRTYLHVTPGRVMVSAWWLDRKGGAKAVVENGETTTVVVTLRKPQNRRNAEPD
jgi:hypothetical protein